MIYYDVIGDRLEWCSAQLVQLDVVTLVATVHLQTSRFSPFRVVSRQKIQLFCWGFCSAGGYIGEISSPESSGDHRFKAACRDKSHEGG